MTFFGGLLNGEKWWESDSFGTLNHSFKGFQVGKKSEILSQWSSSWARLGKSSHSSRVCLDVFPCTASPSSPVASKGSQRQCIEPMVGWTQSIAARPIWNCNTSSRPQSPPESKWKPQLINKLRKMFLGVSGNPMWLDERWQGKESTHTILTKAMAKKRNEVCRAFGQKSRPWSGGYVTHTRMMKKNTIHIGNDPKSHNFGNLEDLYKYIYHQRGPKPLLSYLYNTKLHNHIYSLSRFMWNWRLPVISCF